MSIWSLHKQCAGISPLPPVSDPRINHGAPIPCYDMAGDINTLEGWNASAMAQNIRSFRAHFGREPENYAEVDGWVSEIASSREFENIPIIYETSQGELHASER